MPQFNLLNLPLDNMGIAREDMHAWCAEESLHLIVSQIMKMYAGGG